MFLPLRTECGSLGDWVLVGEGEGRPVKDERRSLEAASALEVDGWVLVGSVQTLHNGCPPSNSKVSQRILHNTAQFVVDGEWTLVDGCRHRTPTEKVPTELSALAHTAPTSAPLLGHTSFANKLSEGEDADGFVEVPETLATSARSFARRRPHLTCALLWAWFSVLLLGELATTFLWVHSLGFRGVAVLGIPCCIALSMALSFLGPEQVMAISVSAALAAMPGLPAYSAVLLIVPPNVSGSWEALHWPSLAIVGLMYLAATLLPILRAEHPSPGCLIHCVVQTLEAAQRLTRGICIIAAWVFLAFLLHFAATLLRNGPREAAGFWSTVLAEPLTTGRGLVLTLHALGLLCAEARQRTVSELGPRLLPLLIGARAQALTLRALAKDHGRGMLRRVPLLRRWTPPPAVVVFLIALRRTAAILFPTLALLPQARRGWLAAGLLFLLGLGVASLVVATAAREWRELPRSPLRRLPLLLPSGVAPCTRKLLGFALVAADSAEAARKNTTWIRRCLWHLPKTPRKRTVD